MTASVSTVRNWNDLTKAELIFWVTKLADCWEAADDILCHAEFSNDHMPSMRKYIRIYNDKLEELKGMAEP